MKYLDSITKVAASKQYAGKNIRTTDGTIAYVAADGTTKGYPDMDAFTATAGFNGCPANSVQLNQEWASLGFPPGSVMAKGQSCGMEGSYVTAAPPETKFDPTFYKKEYIDLANMTNEQATAHWNSYGKTEGRLPNGSIMQSMTAVGQVGYVDFNTVLHRIPPAALSFGDYKIYKKRSNLTGSAMADCTPSAGINFGGRVVIANNDLTGAVNSETALKFGTTSTAFFVRPVPNSAATTIHYGDSITLATSITNYSSTCGYWGCSVSFVNATTLGLMFGPGRLSGGTPLTVVAPSGYTTGGLLRYGAPFMLSAVLASDTLYATVVSSALVFQKTDANTMFSFANPDATETTGCDMSDLKQQCGSDCSGFVHNPETNEWQQITADTKYKITSTLQDVYVKTPVVRMGDTSCTASAAKFVDSSQFAKYLPGTEFTAGGKNQCGPNDALANASDAYTDAIDDQYDRAEQYADEYDSSTLTDRMNQYKATTGVTQRKSDEYQATLAEIRSTPAAVTYAQQQNDSEVVDRQRKAQFALWVVAAAAALGVLIIILKRNKGS